MFETINTESSVAVYVQIKNLVQYAIASGKLKGGNQLPSMLGLAKQLGVNINTVSTAYRELEIMGLIRIQKGTGIFANSGVEAKCRKASHSAIVQKLRETVAEAKAAGLTPKTVRESISEAYTSNGGPYQAPRNRPTSRKVAAAESLKESRRK